MFETPTAPVFADIFKETEKSRLELEASLNKVFQKKTREAGYDLLQAIRDNIDLHSAGNMEQFIAEIKKDPKYAVEVLTDGETIDKFIKYLETIA